MANRVWLNCTPVDLEMPSPDTDLEAHLRWRSERSGVPLEEVRRMHHAVVERRAREIAQLEEMFDAED